MTDSEVLQSREQHGRNILTPPEKESLFRKFLDKFSDPLIRIIMVAGLLSVGIACYEYWSLGHGWEVFFEPIGIFVAILLATGFSFYFEMIAEREFLLLNQVNDAEPVRVIRNGNTIEVPKSEIVVGDIILLSTGDEVPADAELLDAQSLRIDESTLTGEPICSKTTVEADFDAEATFPSNHVMRGTKIMEGHGTARVFAVGDSTENGRVFEAAQIDDSVKTPLNEQLEGLSEKITVLSYLFAALVIVGRFMVFFDWSAWAMLLVLPTTLFCYFAVRKFKSYSTLRCVVIMLLFFVAMLAMIWGLFVHLHPDMHLAELFAYTMQTLMIAVTLIVVAVPEGLPMAVTLSLAYSMRKMLSTNNLVRRMHACETMGATTVICTDKTGTLTCNRMRVAEANFYALATSPSADSEEFDRIAEGIALNSTASLDMSDVDDVKPLGNPTEGALLMWLYDKGVDYRTIKQHATIIEELPFSTERKYMATVVCTATGERVLYVKGAPEIVYAMCSTTAAQVDSSSIEAQLSRFRRRPCVRWASPIRRLRIAMWPWPMAG